jgi:DNA-binding PadR family transcriptional regulator
LEGVFKPASVKAGGGVSGDNIRGSSDRSVLVLTSLASGAKHGYALIKDIEEFAGVTMGPGTLYGCLGKLESSGLIAPLPTEERRHPYRITPLGAAFLSERLTESVRVAKIGLKRLSVAR